VAKSSLLADIPCPPETYAWVMLLAPEKLYFELGRLIAEMPDLTSGPVTPEVRRWLTSVTAVVKSSGGLTEPLQLAMACDNLDGPLRARHAETITNILHRVLVKAEANAPREIRGSVLVIGENLDAYVAMRQLLTSATADALLVEPDAAAKLLADYAILAPERVTVRVLADEAQYRSSLIEAIERWEQRFGDGRTLMVRLAAANTLFERLVLLDDDRAWVVGVPFSHLAKRTHTTLVRMRPEEEVRKIAVYSEIWNEAKPL
jgi:hypothetical protein